MSEQPTRIMQRTPTGQAYRAIKLISIGLIGVTVGLIGVAMLVLAGFLTESRQDTKSRVVLCHVKNDYKRMIVNGRRIVKAHPENLTVRRSLHGWKQTYKSFRDLKCNELDQ